jgi:hypothetical protein
MDKIKIADAIIKAFDYKSKAGYKDNVLYLNIEECENEICSYDKAIFTVEELLEWAEGVDK